MALNTKLRTMHCAAALSDHSMAATTAGATTKAISCAGPMMVSGPRPAHPSRHQQQRDAGGDTEAHTEVAGKSAGGQCRGRGSSSTRHVARTTTNVTTT